MKREFLMLGQPCKEPVFGWWASEKIDGIRAFWDGGISRGMLLHDVPWSAPKARGRYATGLWSRLGNVIYAPDYWLNKLPPIPLDGELFYMNFQKTVSICKKQNPHDLINSFLWSDIQYHVFDSPPLTQVFRSGTIGALTGKNKSKWHIDAESCREFTTHGSREMVYKDVYASLCEAEFWNDQVVLMNQVELGGQDHLDDMLEKIFSRDGEGVILRNPMSLWVPRRTSDVLKIKSYYDEEGTITGLIWGRGKYEGMLGALIIKTADGKTLELSGMTDSERELLGTSGATKEPGKPIVDKNVVSTTFAIGDTITFRYRSLSNDGVPKEARYMRKREES